MTDDANPDRSPDDEAPQPSAADIRTLRLQKLARLREAGIEVYPSRFDRDRTLAELRAEFEPQLEPGDETEVEVRVAGRILLKREQGRLTFAQLRDRDGAVQLFVSQGVLGKETFAGLQRPRPGRLGGRRRHGDGHPQGRAVGEGRRPSRCSARRCARSPTSGGA